MTSKKRRKKESEKDLEILFTREVKRLDGMSFKFVPLHISGLPDRIGLLPGGRILFAEIKTTGESTKPLQRVIIARIKRLGFRVEVLDSSEQIKELFREYEK